MHPALSIIVFTTASGAGYGLLALCGVLAALGLAPSEPGLALAACGLALVLISGGLLASMVHLGRPERAWRAFSQWRSSWLSREGVAAIATFVPACAFAALWILRGAGSGAVAALGLVTAVMAAVTVGCTAMIYASLKPVHQWRSPWVPPAYLALALMTGALWLHALLRLWGRDGTGIALVACAAIALGLALKEAYWRDIRAAAPSTPETATGLGRYGTVRLLDPPHTEENYLLREMGFRLGRKHAARLRNISRFAGFLLPLALTLATFFAAGRPGAVMALAAALSASLGVLIERWLFFAEAKHTVTLYYGARRV